MKPLHKRALWIVATIVALPIAVYALAASYFVLVLGGEDYAHRAQFDAEGWRSRSLDGDPLWPTRLRMVDDLLNRRFLDGLTRQQVEETLGPPDTTSKWRDWDLVYHLGPERGLVRIDSEWLVLRFDAAGHVAAYRIVRD